MKGIYDIRVFIAHDYDGVNLAIIERVIREKIPQLKATVEQIVSLAL
ncbi:HepT-like ribonuclease domain-containing protein [Sulfuricurvum sp.]